MQFFIKGEMCHLHTITKHCGSDIREHDYLVHNQLLKQLTPPF